MTNEIQKPKVMTWFDEGYRVNIPEVIWHYEKNLTYPTGGWKEKSFCGHPINLKGLCPDDSRIDFYDGGEGNGLVMVATYENKDLFRDTGYSEISVGKLVVYHMDEKTGLVKCLLFNPRASESEWARERSFWPAKTAHTNYQKYTPIEITPEKVVLRYSTGGFDNTDALHGPVHLKDWRDTLEIRLDDPNLPIVETDRWSVLFHKEMDERMKSYSK